MIAMIFMHPSIMYGDFRENKQNLSKTIILIQYYFTRTSPGSLYISSQNQKGVFTIKGVFTN